MLLRGMLRNSIVGIRLFASQHSKIVLGIESTFDDTGAAIVDCDATILGEALIRQSKEHVRTGGVDPRVAELLHQRNLPLVVEDVLRQANLDYKNLDAVATATKPGNPFCLKQGLEYSKNLVHRHRLKFIPVHHMEAHLLTVRMKEKIKFPFLGLLVTGGHCIITIAFGLGNYKILGEAIDEPPGAVFDKIARALQVADDRVSTPERLWTGKDVEELARHGNCSKVKLTTPLLQSPRVFDFSFSGLQTQTLRSINQHGVNLADIAASFQRTMTRHILNRVHRAILMSHDQDWFDKISPTLVVAGGVVCNNYFREALSNLCDITNITMVCPPLRLCQDNGVMIAWTGMEYLKEGKGISPNPDQERYAPKCDLGENISKNLRKISVPKLEIFGS